MKRAKIKKKSTTLFPFWIMKKRNEIFISNGIIFFPWNIFEPKQYIVSFLNLLRFYKILMIWSINKCDILYLFERYQCTAYDSSPDTTTRRSEWDSKDGVQFQLRSRDSLLGKVVQGWSRILSLWAKRNSRCTSVSAGRRIRRRM